MATLRCGHVEGEMSDDSAVDWMVEVRETEDGAARSLFLLDVMI
jgi:hypothetical protein